MVILLTRVGSDDPYGTFDETYTINEIRNIMKANGCKFVKAVSGESENEIIVYYDEEY